MRGLVILVPVLQRPHRVQPLLESIAASTPGEPRVLFIVDPGDHPERAAVRAAGGEELAVAGNYATKINAGVDATIEPLIFTGADDIHPHPGWLQEALTAMTAGIGVVGTNDLCNPRTATGELSTHSLVARWYAALGTIDEPGKLLHEGYPHELVDDELVQTARHRGMYAHAPTSIIEHLHPMAGKAPMDPLYAGQRRRLRAGRRLYRTREHLWT